MKILIKRMLGPILIVTGGIILVISVAADILGFGNLGSGFGPKQYIMATTGLVIMLTGILILRNFQSLRYPVNHFWKYFSILLLAIIVLYGSLLILFPVEIGPHPLSINSFLGSNSPPNDPLFEELLLFFETRAQEKWQENQERFDLDRPISPDDAKDLINAIQFANRDSMDRFLYEENKQKISDIQEQLISEENGSRRYRIHFQNDLGLSVEGILSIPMSPGPHPLIIIPNGMGSIPENLFLIDREDYHHGVACRFEGDYAVFALHIPSDPDFSYELAMHNKMNWAAEEAGMDYRYYLTVDKVVSALDYLESKPEVDSSRIAIYGISMGGDTAIDAGILDDRIDIVAASGTNVFTPIYQKLFKDWIYEFPYYYQFDKLSQPDAGTKILGAYPRRIIIELNQQDTTGDFQEAFRRARQIERVYSLLGIEDDVSIITFDHKATDIVLNGHEMEVNQVKNQIDRWFGIQPSVVDDCPSR